VNIAYNCAVEAYVARQVRRVGRRKRGVDIMAVSRRIIVFLGDVDLRACRKDCSP